MGTLCIVKATIAFGMGLDCIWDHHQMWRTTYTSLDELDEMERVHLQFYVLQ